MLQITLYLLLIMKALMLRAEKIFVSKDETKSPCSGCLKSNSFLEALDRAFHGDENYFIFLDDNFHIDSAAIKLFLDGKTIQSLLFTESLTEVGRDISIKGNKMSEIFFYEQPISININKIKINIENIHLIFTKQFSQMQNFNYFFCLMVSKEYLGSIILKNSHISFNSSWKNELWDYKQNYSFFELSGSNFILKIENTSIFTHGYEIFKNLAIALPIEKHLIGERGFFLKNVQIKGDYASTVLISYFLDMIVEMISVTIDNIKNSEMVGIRSILKLENSTFYLNNSNEFVGRQSKFLHLEKSELIVKELFLMGDSAQSMTEESMGIFVACKIDCIITISQLWLQRIFLNQVNKYNNFLKNNSLF